MSDEFKSGNNSEELFDSIEETRKKKIEHFKLNIDESLLEVGNQDDKTDESKQSGLGYDLDYFDDLKSDEKSSPDEINSYSDENAKERIAKNSKKVQEQKDKDEKKRIKEKGKKNRRIFRITWLISVIVVSVLLSQLLLVGANDMLAVKRTENETVKISIPANPTLDSIANLLVQKGIIDNAAFFKMYANITNSSDGFRQGNYEMRTNMDYEAIINYLQSNSNRTDSKNVTISEGMSVLQIAEKLKSEGVLSDVNKFLELCNSNNFDQDFEFLQNIKNGTDRYYKLEGYLYPDTYEFYVNEDPELTISRFLSNYRKRVIYTKDKVDGFDKKVSIEQRAEKTGYSLDQIMTIASIIQAEAANKEDMYYISSILHNRLKAGVDSGVQTLDCDSTAYYPYHDEESVPDSLKSTFKSSYNTYKIKGLPAGAICNPGMDAIEAAINPYDTNYLFFCHSAATDTQLSEAYYATNIEDHNYNKYLAGLTD